MVEDIRSLAHFVSVSLYPFDRLRQLEKALDISFLTAVLSERAYISVASIYLPLIALSPFPSTKYSGSSSSYVTLAGTVFM